MMHGQTSFATSESVMAQSVLNTKKMGDECGTPEPKTATGISRLLPRTSTERQPYTDRLPNPIF